MIKKMNVLPGDAVDSGTKRCRFDSRQVVSRSEYIKT